MRNLFCGAIILAAAFLADGSATRAGGAAIVVGEKPSAKTTLAARETRRYIYQRTGELPPIVDRLPDRGDAIVFALDATLGDQQYRMKTTKDNDRAVLRITGGSDVALLYGAYDLAEKLGVRFYMHGDVIPDERIAMALPELDETRAPLFATRGIQPFHDFPEGPDWWNLDDYKAILGQLPKMRMNFFGLHTYPEGGVGPEPVVWIGLPEDVGPDGRAKAAYPSRHFATCNQPTFGQDVAAWGYAPTKTGDYAFGAATIFDRDDYGADYMRGVRCFAEMTLDETNALFDRMGDFLGEAFTFARRLGIKTCVGTETPMIIPTAVQERLKKLGKDPKDPAVVRELYEGSFRWIAKNYPVDYYWLWTPEDWTWSGVKQERVEATLADLRAAMAAAEKACAPFTLATCGWVLGPPEDRALFDKTLPKNVPLSCINREVGHAPVEPGFAKIEGRPKWAIPWMEDDPALIIPQLWAGRMREDAVDARKYGCTGLMGIHWRTRELGPNVSALAHAAWDQSWPSAEPEKQPAAKGPAPEGPESGLFAHFPNNPIDDTEDDPLYQNVRYDVKAYRFDVPNGAYTVTLKFCEPYYDQKGLRSFGVKIQGKQVIGVLDIFGEVGKNRAMDRVFKDVKVTDGRLVIDFVHVQEYPCIAAIAVEGPATRKVNCGGQAYKDYQADWPESGSTKQPRRGLPADDFYADWAQNQFGAEVAEPLGKLFSNVDGRLPRPSTWVNGPGGIQPDAQPWDEVQKQYAFVDTMAALADKIRGEGNRERFDYWLNQFRYLRGVARANCTWARYNKAIEQVKAEKDPQRQKQLARDVALPIRKELVAQVAELNAYLLATATTPGGLGNVANWQQHVMPMLLGKPGEELAAILGEPLPADALPGKDYAGPPRIIVPTQRTQAAEGEALTIRVIVLDGQPPKTVALYHRAMGPGPFAKIDARHVARGVYTVTLPPAEGLGVEYYVQVETPGGITLVWPPTAPKLNQTLVVERVSE
jgi:hypothetical protein